MDEALALLNNHQTDLDLVKVQLASVGLLTNADFISQSCRSWMCCQARGPSRACPNSFLDQCAQPPMPHAWLLSRPAWPGTFRGSCQTSKSINQSISHRFTRKDHINVYREFDDLRAVSITIHEDTRLHSCILAIGFALIALLGSQIAQM